MIRPIPARSDLRCCRHIVATGRRTRQCGDAAAYAGLRQAGRSQHRPSPGQAPQGRLPRQRPHQGHLHPGPVRSRSVPGELGLRQDNRRDAAARPAALGTVYLRSSRTRCPTSSLTSRPRLTCRSRSTWSVKLTRLRALSAIPSKPCPTTPSAPSDPNSSAVSEA